MTISKFVNVMKGFGYRLGTFCGYSDRGVGVVKDLSGERWEIGLVGKVGRSPVFCLMVIVGMGESIVYFLTQGHASAVSDPFFPGFGKTICRHVGFGKREFHQEM